MEIKRSMFLLLNVLNIKCAIKDQKIKTFGEIRFEMIQNPFIFYISTHYHETIRIMIHKKMINDFFDLFPISQINEKECDLNFFKLHDINNLIRSDVTLYKYFKYFKPKTCEVWFEIFKYRHIYMIFNFFRDYLSEYSALFNEHPLFGSKMKSFLENSYLKKLDCNRCIKYHEVKELETLVKADIERCDNVAQKISIDENPNNINIVGKQIIECDIQFGNTQHEDSISINKTKECCIISPPNQDKINSYIEKAEFVEKLSPEVSNPLISSPDNVSCDEVSQYIILDSLEMIIFDIIGFFKSNIEHNSNKLLYNFDFTCYKDSSLFKFHRNLLKDELNTESKSIIFGFFYKKMYNNYQSYFETILSSLNEISSKGFTNLTYFLFKILKSPIYKIGIVKDLYYLPINSKYIPKMNYTEKILVFDIDDTLFPTTYYLKNTKNFMSSNENSDFDDPNYVSKIDAKKTIEELKTIKIIDHFKNRKKLKWYLNNLPYKKICLTNASKPHAEFVLKTLDIQKCFEFVLYRSIDMKQKYMKPNTYPFMVVEMLLGCGSNNIYFYDDNSDNFATAFERNWRSFLIDESLIETVEDSLNT